jgi:hypothetical protein
MLERLGRLRDCAVKITDMLEAVLASVQGKPATSGRIAPTPAAALNGKPQHTRFFPACNQLIADFEKEIVRAGKAATALDELF